VKYFQTPDGKLRPMTYEELRDLPLMDSVIRETLRIHPPIHSIMRNVRQDIPVPATLSAPSKDGVYVVPKGHYLLASPAVSQMDPALWVDPAKWDPYRWSDPEGAAAKLAKAYSNEHGEQVDYGFGFVSKGTESQYQPFGAGRHRCIGEQVCPLFLLDEYSTLTFVPLFSLHIYNSARLWEPWFARLRCGWKNPSHSTIIRYVFGPTLRGDRL
jgi:sterol 14-demethylase